MKQAILLLCLLIPCIASSQIIQSVGVKGGLCLASQSWLFKSINLEYRDNYRLGGFGAVGVELLDKDYFRLNIDIGLIQKGLKEEAIVVNAIGKVIGNQKLVTRFNYLFIAATGKLQYQVGPVIPYVFLGPKLDFQLSYSTNYDIRAFEGDFAKVIFGLNYGLGAQYLIKQLGIGLEVSRHHDLTNIYNTSATSTNTGLRIKNNAFTFNLVLRYYLVEQNGRDL